MFKKTGNKAVLSATLVLLFCFMNIGQTVISAERPVLRGAATTNIKLEGDMSFINDSQPITVSLRDSDVKQAIRMFADKAGMNVIFHDSVRGNITLDIVDVPLGDALKMIGQMAELTYIIEANTIMVVSNKAANDLNVSKSQMSVIPLKYLDATSAASFLNNNIFQKSRPGLSNSNIATANTIKNELILFGKEEDFKMAQKVLSKIDVKPYISTYKVNHTTPAEMASMICQSLFNVDGSATSGSDAGWSEDIKLGAAFKACEVKSNQSGAGNIGSNNLVGIEGPALTVSYIPTLGNVQVVGGTTEQIQLISDFIAHNDKKQPQAYIEMSIVELSENGSKEFQNSWNIYSNFFTGSIGGNGIQTAENYPIFWKNVNNLDEWSDIDYGRLFRGVVLQDPTDTVNYNHDVVNALLEYNYAMDKYNNELAVYDKAVDAWKEAGGSWADMPTAPEAPRMQVVNSKISTVSQSLQYTQPMAITQSLNYVIQNGKGRVLSNPKIVVTNGKKSSIDLTSDIVKSVSEQILTSSSTGALSGTSKTYNISSDNGIKIELVPFISPDGYVSLNIKPNYRTVAEKIYAPDSRGINTLQATLMSKRDLELSNIRVKDGETLVLGGFIQEFESKSVSKTPILGDLPIVGFLFRNSATTNQKSELVILITPRIIKDNEDVVGTSDL